MVIGTEATGVSRELLAACHRRVYLPQNGFADSLNASVAAALVLQTVLLLYGELACGDLAREMEAAGDYEGLQQIRLRWIWSLSRDESHFADLAARAAQQASAPLDDLRRHASYREHTGKLQHIERRAVRRAQQEAQHEAQQGVGGD